MLVGVKLHVHVHVVNEIVPRTIAISEARHLL